MTTNTEASFRRVRTSKPKVRTGCLTCKARRVKCDETRPECQRCTFGGRQCDGYPQLVIRKKAENDAAMALLLRKTPDFHTGTSAEVRALEYFYRKTAPQLSGYFDADFWTRLIFQVSNADGAIKHAMIALGSLALQQGQKIERVAYIGSVATTEPSDEPDSVRMNLPLIQLQRDEEERFALMHYNKSIADLASRINKSDIPIEIVLLACILFVCLEFLRGDVQPALKHFRSGMNVTLTSLSHKSSAGQISMHRIKQHMLPFFNRLELLSTIMGNDADWEYSTPLEDAVPRSFATMRQARDSLVHLMNLGIRFVRANRFRKYQNVVLENEVARQIALRKQLDKWLQIFDALVLSEAITTFDLEGAKILRLHHLIATIWSGVALRADESKSDEWNDLFERAVTVADAIQNPAGECIDSSSPSFVFDMEIVSPLWFIVVKCRHPRTRRRAAAILERTGRREGLWDSQLGAIIAERLRTFEERSLNLLDGSELPPECDRVHNCLVSAPATSAHTQRLVVTYYYKPYGMKGPWETLHEQILLARGQ